MNRTENQLNLIGGRESYGRSIEIHCCQINCAFQVMKSRLRSWLVSTENWANFPCSRVSGCSQTHEIHKNSLKTTAVTRQHNQLLPCCNSQNKSWITRQIMNPRIHHTIKTRAKMSWNGAPSYRRCYQSWRRQKSRKFCVFFKQLIPSHEV